MHRVSAMAVFVAAAIVPLNLGCHVRAWRPAASEQKPPERISRISVLALLLALISLSCGCPPEPLVSSFSPSSILAGSPQFLLTVNGDEFRPDSIVAWNNSFRVTTFVSRHQLVATIPARDIVAPGTILVFVLNPAENSSLFVSGAIGGGGNFCRVKRSNAVSFSINP